MRTNQQINYSGKTRSSKLEAQSLNVDKKFLPLKETEVLKKIEGKDLKFTNLDKYLWKKERYTKRDLIDYYHRIAPYILPYLKNRPQSLNRHPNGITQENFFQKNVQGKVADWITTHADYSESNDATIHYFVCTGEASLLYMANLGCIELNPWHSRTSSPNNPDYCIIDLDPNGVAFDKVVETALVTKKILDEIEAPGYCKTSGATGLHIYIPLGAKYDYEQSKQLAQLIAILVNRELPTITSVERNPAKRKRKIYVDFLQNRQGQTIAAPYSLRPKPGATVSTPLYWEEVKKGLTPQQFHIKNIFDRLQSEGDIFTPVLKKGIYLKKVLKNIERLVS
jgi:bifunctional non-homologous end joining protein LigD